MPRLHVLATTVEYSEQGAGQPVVLLHSSASSSAQWRALASRLAPRYRVVAPDLIGYGGTSPWMSTGRFCLAQEAALVRALIARLGEPVHLVGHSYGGAVALHIARTRPDLVRSLVVVEPVAFHLLRDGDAIDAAALREITAVAGAVSVAAACGDTDGASRTFIDYWSGRGAWDGMPAEKQARIRPGAAKVALDFEATLGEPAGIEDMRDMAVPTLLVQGGTTELPTRCICQRLSKALPDAELRVVRGAGHMLPVTHRDQVNALVARFVEAASAPVPMAA